MDALEVFERDALIGAAMREAERVVVLRCVLRGLHIAQIDAVDEAADQSDAGSQGRGGPGRQDGAARDLLRDEVGQRGEGGVGEDAAHGVFAPAGHQGDCAAVGVAVQEDRAGRSAALVDGVVDRAQHVVALVQPCAHAGGIGFAVSAEVEGEHGVAVGDERGGEAEQGAAVAVDAVYADDGGARVGCGHPPAAQGEVGPAARGEFDLFVLQAEICGACAERSDLGVQGLGCYVPRGCEVEHGEQGDSR